MEKILIFLVVFLAFLGLFGCTISINPQDLSPSKKYVTVLDTNTGIVGADTNSTQIKLSLTASEVVKHNSSGNCWMIINGNVYDLSEYVIHPGGSGYLSYCGTNATQGYDTKGGGGNSHSGFADSLLSNYLIGKLGQSVLVADINTSPNPISPSYDDEDEFEDD